MRQSGLRSKLVATFVIAALQGLVLPATAAGPGAEVRGSILSAQEQSPLARYAEYRRNPDPRLDGPLRPSETLRCIFR